MGILGHTAYRIERNVVLVHAMKAYSWRGGINPEIVNVSPGWR